MIKNIIVSIFLCTSLNNVVAAASNGDFRRLTGWSMTVPGNPCDLAAFAYLDVTGAVVLVKTDGGPGTYSTTPTGLDRGWDNVNGTVAPTPSRVSTPRPPASVVLGALSTRNFGSPVRRSDDMSPAR